MVYWPRTVRAQAHFQERTPLARQGPLRAQHDAAVLAELYEQYYERVAWYITARVSNRDLAEDLAGDVFLRCVESIGAFEQRGVPMQAWLFRVAHNIVIDHYRRSGRRQATALDEADEQAGRSDPPGEVEQKLLMERVYAAIGRLNASQQEVVSLRFIAGLSSEETGQVMGRTNGAVRELQRTALKALRGILGTDVDRVPFGPADGGERG